MKIGEVIRIYRKKENLTQEQIANYLNVSAPAVNKWENGISYPDIELLAPLARILKIDVNMLLSFNVELTKEEIRNFLEQISRTVSEDGIDEGFKKAVHFIKKYPNCDNLVIHVAESMNMHNKLNKGDNYDEYNKKVISWYEILSASNNKRTSKIGKFDLIIKYIESEQYEQAQKLLDTIEEDSASDLNWMKNLYQAQIFEKTNKGESAYEIYEGMILKSANEIMLPLSLIIKQLCDENKYDIAEKYIDILQKTVVLYDLDKLSLFQSKMIISLHKKDKESAIKDLEKVISEIEKFSEDDKSELYVFRKYKNRPYDSKKYRELIKILVDKNSDYEFIRSDSRVKKIFEKSKS
ncbi:MAG: helix-turn-helix transcriptional regulator [Romboutsia sp.]|nr:helix-turn-helix transcriptional regulator [Romboutsia sp.]